MTMLLPLNYSMVKMHLFSNEILSEFAMLLFNFIDKRFQDVAR